jgi:NitT/TauT family transport system substrate-binding protein
MKSLVSSAVAALVLASPALAQEDLTRVTFATNWLPQAEHGGFYQAVADGTYAECGLEVEIVPGGPQVNNRALMLAGQIDFHMGGDMMAAFNAVEQEIPLVVVAAIFQKYPQVIISHPGVADTWEELKDLTLLISDNSYNTYYRWMMEVHGFTADQRRPYTFNPAPFIADENVGMQGYLSSEPFAVLKQTGWEPNVFLIADYGFNSYANTIETMRSTVEERPEVVECFVNASLTGWYNFLYGDNGAADELIKAANPDMSQDKIDYARSKLTDWGIVDSGDALTLGIGAMTDEVIGDFYGKLVESGVMEPGLDWRAAYTLDFTNGKVGMELRPGN